MSIYTQKVRANILPLSVAASLPEAFEEWSFTDNTIDHEAPIESCQLCDQEDVRYHFEIRNALTGLALWVGSQCILKFGVSVFEDGRRLSAAETKRKLHRLTSQMRQKSCIRSLERLAEAESNDILKCALDQYRTRKSLTPKQAFVVLWRLQANRIDHSPSFFKVELKKQKHKDDLIEMQGRKLATIWPALTASQRRGVVERGIVPPI